MLGWKIEESVALCLVKLVLLGYAKLDQQSLLYLEILKTNGNGVNVFFSGLFFNSSCQRWKKVRAVRALLV